MEKTKSSFILYTDYENKFEMLSDEQLGKLIRIIITYEKTQQNPTITQLEPIVQMAFTFIKGDLDRARVKYNASVKNGNKGGRPKKGAINKTQQNPSKPNLNLNDNEDVNDNVNVNEDVNDNEKVFNDLAMDELPFPDIQHALSVKEQELANIDNTNLFDLLETEFGRPISQREVTLLGEWQSTYEHRFIYYAIREAVMYEKTSFDYIDTILVKWKSKGYSVADIEDGKQKERED